MANPIIKTYAELSGTNNLYWGNDIIKFNGISNYNISRIGNMVHHSQNIICEEGKLGEKINDEALIIECIYLSTDSSIFPISTCNVYSNLKINLFAITIPGTNNIIITTGNDNNARKTNYEDFLNDNFINLSFTIAYMAI